MLSSGIGLLILIFVIILMIILLCGYWKIHPVLALLLGSLLLGIGAGLPLLEVINAIQSGFGGLMKYIGLVVVAGSIIGVFLERSGAAIRIAQFVVKLSGKNNTIGAMSVMGALISIPVFCDSGFILLSSLTKRLAALSGKSKASLSLALATGLYTTHTLVPPTPGPIAAAGNLGASDALGMIIVLGVLISIPILILSQHLAKRFGAKISVATEEEFESANIEEFGDLPSLISSLLPVLLPLLLIGAGTINSFFKFNIEWIAFIGNPLMALLIGALAAILLLRKKYDASKKEGDWKSYITEAIRVAGPILIITGAGGAFGGVLKATALSDTVSTWLSDGVGSEIVALLIVFTIAAVLKTAQGSSTSAMVISSSILAPLVPVLGWDQPIDFALAIMVIGGGAMTVSHYNDSYFWVVSQFSGMSHQATNRSFSVISGVMGLTILGICLVLASVF